MAWGIDEAWAAAVEIAAAAHGVKAAALREPSRGRGYKPPARVIAARKAALHLTVLVTGCGYAELAAFVGFHRDTVHSHCVEMSRRTDGDRVELASERLEALVRARLAAARAGAIGQVRALLERMEADAAQNVASSDAVAAIIRQPETYHDNVIDIPQKRASA